MYASQTRTNTKYTEFIRGYYPDLKNVTDQSPEHGFNHFDSYTFPLKKHSSIVDINGGSDSVGGELDTDSSLHNFDTLENHPKIEIQSQYNLTNYHFNITPSIIGGKTKYGDIFDETESPALRLKLLRETEERFGGKTKTFSDSDLVLLHHKVQQSYQLLSPRNLSAAPTASHRSHKTRISHTSSKIIADEVAAVASLVGSQRSRGGGDEAPSKHQKNNSIDLESVILHPAADPTIGGGGTKKTKGDTASRGISELESDLQRLNDETLRVLSHTRSRSISTPRLEELGVPQSGRTIGDSSIKNHVSYQEILKAEHVALRRELLSNIREISRATFNEDFHSVKQQLSQDGVEPQQDDGEGEGEPSKPEVDPSHPDHTSGREDDHELPTDEVGKTNSAKRTDNTFHLNLQPGTADPSERVDLWIKDSQEHLAREAAEAAAASIQEEEEEKKSSASIKLKKKDSINSSPSQALSQQSHHTSGDRTTSPPMHASLFHDSIWAEENENGDQVNVTDAEHVEDVDTDTSNVIPPSPHVLASTLSVHSASLQVDKTNPLVIHNNFVINNYDHEIQSRVETAQVHDVQTGQDQFVVAVDNFRASQSSTPHDQSQSPHEIDHAHSAHSNQSHNNTNDDDNLIVDHDNIVVSANNSFDNPPIENVEEPHSHESNDIQSHHDLDDDQMPHYTIPHANTVEEDDELSEVVVVEQEEEEEESGGDGGGEEGGGGGEEIEEEHVDIVDDDGSVSKKSNNSFPKSTKTARSNSASELDINSNRSTKVMIPTLVALDNSPHRTFTKYSDYYRPNNSNSNISNALATTPNAANASISKTTSLGSSPNRKIGNGVKVLPPVVVIPQATRESFPDRIYQPKLNYKHLVDRANREASKKANSNPSTTTNYNTTSSSSNYIHSNSKSSSTISNSNTIKTFSKVNDPPRKNVTQVGSDGHVQPGYIKNPRGKGKVPGIIRRHNMDQWVAKKLYFFINGDEHFPKFEFRFKPQKDVKNLDTLCDILSKKLNLDRGVRFIFTIDGQKVERIEDLRHESYYVVSSTKKFKVINRFHFGAKPNFNSSFKPTSKPNSVPNLQLL